MFGIVPPGAFHHFSVRVFYTSTMIIVIVICKHVDGCSSQETVSGTTCINIIVHVEVYTTLERCQRFVAKSRGTGDRCPHNNGYFAKSVPPSPLSNNISFTISLPSEFLDFPRVRPVGYLKNLCARK